MLDMCFCKNLRGDLIFLKQLSSFEYWNFGSMEIFFSDLVKLIKLAPGIPIWPYPTPTSFSQLMLRSYVNCTGTIRSDGIHKLC
jgi:hypothetical protein